MRSNVAQPSSLWGRRASRLSFRSLAGKMPAAPQPRWLCYDSTIARPYFKIDIVTRLPFITFEGSEGCGKTTQVQRLAAGLEKMGIQFLLTREPGGTPIGETIRELLQFAPHSSAMTPETEVLLFEASRSQLVREIITPALK